MTSHNPFSDDSNLLDEVSELIGFGSDDEGGAGSGPGEAVKTDEIPNTPPFKIYLHNLHVYAVKKNVYDFFQGLKIIDVYLPPRSNYPGNKGYGHVEFESRADLIDALGRNGQRLKGQRIYIYLFKEPKVNVHLHGSARDAERKKGQLDRKDGESKEDQDNDGNGNSRNNY